MVSDIFSFLSDTLAFSIVLVVKGGQGKMSKSLLRTDKEIAEIYKRHSKTVYRVCFAYMKNPADTEDAVQDTFFQLIKSGIGGADTRTSRISTISPAQKISKQMIFSKWLWNSPKSIRPWSICIIMKDIPAWKSQAS